MTFSQSTWPMPDVAPVTRTFLPFSPRNADSRPRYDLLFADEFGDYLDHWDLRQRFYAALAKAKLGRVRLHVLRHCAGTLFAQVDPLQRRPRMARARGHRRDRSRLALRPGGRCGREGAAGGTRLRTDLR